MQRRHILRHAALVGLLGLSATAGAQDAYPSKPITLVVPQAAGSGSDIVARLLARELQREFNATVVVDNKPGGNGAIAAQAVARAAPDGYTLLVAITGLVQMPIVTKAPFDPIRDSRRSPRSAPRTGRWRCNPIYRCTPSPSSSPMRSSSAGRCRSAPTRRRPRRTSRSRCWPGSRASRQPSFTTEAKRRCCRICSAVRSAAVRWQR